MSRSYSAALPTAYVFLRILILLNWLGGAAILALLTATVVAEQWTLTALGIAPSSWISPILTGLQAIAVLGLIGVPLNHVVLRRLVAIVVTVRTGDPFVAANAYRLQAIAWALLALQLLGLVIGAIGEEISTPANPVHLDAGFSASGWLAVLMSFVLARIFAYGTLMREDLEGTIYMAIAVRLDDLLHARRMTLTELAERIDITLANLSILKTGKARAIRFSTLEAICAELDCQPGDLLAFEAEAGRAGEDLRAAS